MLKFHVSVELLRLDHACVFFFGGCRASVVTAFDFGDFGMD